jgi:DNA-binding response OmpR family regulator
MKNKILLVEDDLILGESLEELLVLENFDVRWAKDGNEALACSYNENFDIFLFDVDIPFINGFELLKSLRGNDDTTPCIFVSAKIDINSMSEGFDVGADDYIKKPFDFEELLLRINTQIKKSFHTHNNIIKYNDIVYDIDLKSISKDNIEIYLSPTELKLFELFIKNIDTIISKEDIIYHLHNGAFGSENVLRVQISKLKKLGLNIVNQRAVGYKVLSCE